MLEKGIKAKIEESGLLKSRNIVIGDLSKARIIFTAHYNTANDNTSGVIVINEVLCRYGGNLDKVAFVLFDHEEIGIVGSYFFAKRHKEIIKDKLIVNLDCVSDGDYIMVMKKRTILKGDKIDSLLYVSFSNIPVGKELYIEDNSSFGMYLGQKSVKEHGFLTLENKVLIDDIG